MKVDTIPPELRELRQWLVWKFVKRANGHLDKVPYQPSGTPARTNDPLTWSTFDDVKAASARYDGVGFVFSSDDPYVGIDLDGCRDHDTGVLSEWAKGWVGRFDSYCEVSPSGTGVKIFVRGKNPLGSGKNHKLDGQEVEGKEPGVEIYDSGRYFAVTGERLADYPTSCEQRQAVIDEFCRHYWPPKAERPPSTPLSHYSGDDYAIGRALKYIAPIPGAIQGSNGSGATFGVACILWNGFALSVDQTFEILKTHYNPSCKPEWSDKELMHKAVSASTTPHTEPRGYILNAERKADNLLPVDISGLIHPPDDLDDEPDDDLPPDPGEMPSHLLHVPGFVNELVEYMQATAPYPVRTYSFAAALTFAAFLYSRKIRDPQDNRSSIYLILIAPPGSGKDHGRQVVQQCMLQVGLAGHLITDLGSAEGLEDLLIQKKRLLIQWDEVAEIFQATKNGNEGKMERIMNLLMKLFSEVKGTHTKRVKAGDKDVSYVSQPGLTWYGTTTPTELSNAMCQRLLMNGLLARTNIIASTEHRTPQNSEQQDLPQHLLDIAKWWADRPAGEGDLSEENPTTHVVSMTPQADSIYWDFRCKLDAQMQAAMLKHDDVTQAQLSRGHEIARRLGLIYAASENHESPVIDASAATWACGFAEYCIQTTLHWAATELAESAFHKICNDFLKKMREYADTHNTPIVPARPIFRALRKYKTPDIHQAADALEKQGRIRIERVGTTKPKTVYVVCGWGQRRDKSSELTLAT